MYRRADSLLQDPECIMSVQVNSQVKNMNLILDQCVQTHSEDETLL